MTEQLLGYSPCRYRAASHPRQRSDNQSPDTLLSQRRHTSTHEPRNIATLPGHELLRQPLSGKPYSASHRCRTGR